MDDNIGRASIGIVHAEHLQSLVRLHCDVSIAMLVDNGFDGAGADMGR